MQHFKYFVTIFAIFLLFASESPVAARRHIKRAALCSASSVPPASSSPQPTTSSPPAPPATTSSPPPPPTSTPSTSPPSSPGPPNAPPCGNQSPGVCQLVTKCQPANSNPVQDAWIFNSQCNVIGGTTGLPLWKTWNLNSQLPYVVVGYSNSPTASPSFDYAGGNYGVGGGGNPGWWCAIESDGTFLCYATFNC
ncbi:hypothetical protein CJF31_00000883 [Rutstroemia sp. NJR-2017a BVV2]|nr:hypothetical protein CJF31_00000883 [Rutstroemia sp. NJR-2017a BVV2]